MKLLTLGLWLTLFAVLPIKAMADPMQSSHAAADGSAAGSTDVTLPDDSTNAQQPDAAAGDAAADVPQYHEFEFHAQGTWIFQKHPSFGAEYSGPNSLKTHPETSFTLSATAFFAAHLWQGGEFYADAETLRGKPFSNLTGFGGFPNGELEKGAGLEPAGYVPRIFYRQTWGFGGGTDNLDSDQHQLGETVDHNRFVLTIGKVSITDLFDNNLFSHDARTQFFNAAMGDYGSYDYAADGRGYTGGIAGELDWDVWAFRAGRFMQPRSADGTGLDFQIMDYHGDQFEIDHSHTLFDQPGKIRFLAFINRAVMGSYDDALAYAQRTDTVPSLNRVRKPQDKRGYGVNLEQNLTSDIGLFGRLGWNDGQTETYAYSEIERIAQIGLSIKGTQWMRPDDTIGIGYAENGLSTAHQHYLEAGGLGVFIGDGALSYHTEDIVELYYSVALLKSVWFSPDYQHIQNPAYNAVRGPVSIYGVRLHAEY